MNPWKRLPNTQYRIMFISLVLLFGVCLHQGNGFLAAEPIGEVVPTYSQVIEGSNLTLNCTLKSYSITPLRSSALYFIAVYQNIPQEVDSAFYNILTRHTLQLLIPNVKREDGQTFKCYMNDSDLTNKSDTFINSASVDIGQPPNPIVSVSVVSDNFDNMTVSWCSTVSQVDPVDSHLAWAIEDSLHSGNCSVWKNISRCACMFCGTSLSLPCIGKEMTFYTYQNYSITITSFNPYGSTRTSLQFYTGPEIVKPGPVTELAVTQNSSHSLQVSWNHPNGLYPEVFSLAYQINTWSQWGHNSTIDVGADLSWWLTDLTPNTLYTIAVRCKPTEGGYWSDDNIGSNVTMEDVPAVAPEVPVGFFRKSTCLEKDDCQVTYFWKLIDAPLQNGVILGYRITVESTHCNSSCETDVKGSDITSADIGLDDGNCSWVRLVAFTSVGDSPPHYTFFPQYFKSLPSVDDQGLYAEFTKDGTGIFFSWNYVEDVDNYTLMYCVGKSTDKTHCLSSPVSVTLPRHKTNFTMSPVNVDHVYALSSNYRNGTRGLTSDWICIYDYSGFPAKPDIKGITQVTDTSVKVDWMPLTCTTNNRVRVLNYTLSYSSNATLDAASVTLPGSVTEYTITDLTPEIEYTLTLQGVSRSGPGQAATAPVITYPPKSVNIVIPVVVAVTVSVFIVIVIIIIIYAYRRSHRWFHSVTITTPEKHENKCAANDTSNINSNYAASSEIGNGLHTYTNLLMIPNGFADREEELLASSSSQNGIQPTLVHRTEHSESVDSLPSDKTTSASCESDQSIQTYTAVANPGTSIESPSLHFTLNVDTFDGSHLPHHDNIHDVQLQPSIKEPIQDSSGSYGYSQAHHCDNLDSLADSSNSCDGYKSAHFQEENFIELSDPPIAPQIV